jgi:uncharacterized damage-inducible protein DinB
MMKDLLLEQHTACYDENNWFVAIKNAVANLTAEQANWKPEGADNTIWEEVNHLVFWNERWLQRYRGELNEPQDVENNGTFKSDETEWQATLEMLYAIMEEWRAKLEAITDEKLESPVNSQYQAPWRSPLAHQNIHNAYHIGQIVLLRKLQGSWDPKKGVS